MFEIQNAKLQEHQEASKFKNSNFKTENSRLGDGNMGTRGRAQLLPNPLLPNCHISTNSATLQFSPSQTTQNTDSKTEQNPNTNSKEHALKIFTSKER